MILHSNSKNLAVIPARSGSKGLPQKNIKLLNDKPMILYTIEAAIESGCFCEIIISTDDNYIASMANEWGVSAPFIRPSHLATDQSLTIDVVKHAIDFFETQNQFFDSVTILQPTSPLRRAYDIVESMKIFINKDADSVVSVCKAPGSVLFMNTLPYNNSMKDFLDKEVINKRRQDLPEQYFLNGAVYIIKTQIVRENTNFYTNKSYAYLMPRDRSIDVDDIVDFNFCEAILKHSSGMNDVIRK